MNRCELRNLPSVARIAASPALSNAVSEHGRDWVVQLARDALAQARQAILAGQPAPSETEIAAAVLDAIAAFITPTPRPVINAAGVIIHTNLGRAPLSAAALAAAANAANGYSDLEISLDTGRRGSRQAHLQSLLCQLTGAEAALAVNNNASALLLGLSALAAGREVIVARGEAIEIGGGFRIPDVLRQSGCTLVDVGTTNRTYAHDYAAAITDRTAAFLKAHASNFRVQGFTAAVPEPDLVALGAEAGIPVLHDVGSGALLPTDRYGLAHEPMPQESIANGVGLVFFSGDKLLGGPQAGIIVGRRELVSRLERHPLARAVRIDKMNLASLAATLIPYLTGQAESQIPVWQMISAAPDAVRARALRWQAALSACAEVASTKIKTAVVPARSAIGGGSLPGETLPSWALSVSPSGSANGNGRTPETLLAALRRQPIPVIARIEDNAVRLDPRTVLPEQDAAIVKSLSAALASAN